MIPFLPCLLALQIASVPIFSIQIPPSKTFGSQLYFAYHIMQQ